MTRDGSAALKDEAIGSAAQLAAAMHASLSRVVRGKPESIRLALVALFSGGHLLIEDVPGVGKTLLAKGLARVVGGSFRRIQATPDLLPTELTGVSVFHKSSEEWEFRPGPLFANVVLVDEVNRATPRTQSAVLEAMEERQVTVDGTTWALPDPFVLVATQNPFEHAGTFPLVEGQRDRFALVVEMGYPARGAERELLAGQGGAAALDGVVPVASTAQLAAAVTAVRGVHTADAVTDYVLDIAEATRRDPDIALGASPRASLGLLHAAQAHAVVSGRSYVSPDDVKAVAVAALAHRVLPSSGGDLRTTTALVRRIVDAVPAPR